MNKNTQTEQDPILAALARLEVKQDLLLENQAEMDKQLHEMKKEVKRTAAVYGGLGGVIVSTGWELIRMKIGG